MKSQFLKMTGLSEKEFYKLYPTEEAFNSAYALPNKQNGGMQQPAQQGEQQAQIMEIIKAFAQATQADPKVIMQKLQQMQPEQQQQALQQMMQQLQGDGNNAEQQPAMQPETPSFDDGGIFGIFNRNNQSRCPKGVDCGGGGGGYSSETSGMSRRELRKYSGSKQQAMDYFQGQVAPGTVGNRFFPTHSFDPQVEHVGYDSDIDGNIQSVGEQRYNPSVQQSQIKGVSYAPVPYAALGGSNSPYVYSDPYSNMLASYEGGGPKKSSYSALKTFYQNEDANQAPSQSANSYTAVPNENDYPDYESYNAAVENFVNNQGGYSSALVASSQPAVNSVVPEQAIVNAPVAQAPSSYKGVSIVDLLSSLGQPSDRATRNKLAKSLGIKNYTGSATQNARLIQHVQNDPTVLDNVKTYKSTEKSLPGSPNNSVDNTDYNGLHTMGVLANSVNPVASSYNQPSYYDSSNGNQYNPFQYKSSSLYNSLIRAGMDPKAAEIQSRPGVKMLATTKKLLDKQNELEYRVVNSQGYDPSIAIEDQYGLAGGNGLDQRLIRGANMMIGEDLGNPILNGLKNTVFAPGKSFVNISADPYNQYVQPVLQGNYGQAAMNLGSDIMNVAPTIVGKGIGKAANATANMTKKMVLSEMNAAQNVARRAELLKNSNGYKSLVQQQYGPLGDFGPSVMEQNILKAKELAKTKKISTQTYNSLMENVQQGPITRNIYGVSAQNPIQNRPAFNNQLFSYNKKNGGSTYSNGVWFKQGGSVNMGDEMVVTDSQMEQLRKQGYQFDII